MGVNTNVRLSHIALHMKKVLVSAGSFQIHNSAHLDGVYLTLRVTSMLLPVRATYKHPTSVDIAATLNKVNNGHNEIWLPDVRLSLT